MGTTKIIIAPVNQKDFTIGTLASDVQASILKGNYLYGIEKNRVAYLIQSNFKNALNYELFLIAKYLNLYLFQFNEKYPNNLIIV